MKRTKRFSYKALTAVLVIALMSMALVTGCGSGGGDSGPAVTKAVTDCIGREVEVPEEPQRVACLYATAAHMMAMLDQQDKIVGCPNGVKNDVLMQMKNPEITECATPHQEGSINVEELVAIDADLVLLNSSLAANEGEMEKIDKLEIPYVVIDYATIDEVKKAVTVMGEVFGEQEKAAKYNEFFDETIAMVDERLDGVELEEGPQVYHSVNEAIRTDAKGTICPEIMNRAKVRDVSAENGTLATDRAAYVTLEEIYKWNPDAIIANEYAVTDYIMAGGKWQGLGCVKNRAVYTLPVGATRWCHQGSMEAHMGVLAVARQFYPEKFEDFDYKKYIKDYYSEYFGLDLDDKTLEDIMSGEGMRKANKPE